jgi:hypothetical protein
LNAGKKVTVFSFLKLDAQPSRDVDNIFPTHWPPACCDNFCIAQLGAVIGRNRELHETLFDGLVLVALRVLRVRRVLARTAAARHDVPPCKRCH